MRSPEDVFQDIESDRALRESEVRLIENIAARTEAAGEQAMLRRSLVLLTYAHLEGFCKFALSAYAGAINALRMPCREAATPLVAVTLGRIFAALRDVNSKHPYFARSLPNDRELHMLARERIFVEDFQEITKEYVKIPDRAVDTKSNLSSIVLKRNLFQLGLDHLSLNAQQGAIDRLLGVRNAIAHGDALKVPTEADAKEYVNAAFDVMRFIQSEVYGALQDEKYRRGHPQPTTTSASAAQPLA